MLRRNVLRLDINHESSWSRNMCRHAHQLHMARVDYATMPRTWPWTQWGLAGMGLWVTFEQSKHAQTRKYVDMRCQPCPAGIERGAPGPSYAIDWLGTHPQMPIPWPSMAMVHDVPSSGHDYSAQQPVLHLESIAEQSATVVHGRLIFTPRTSLGGCGRDIIAGASVSLRIKPISQEDSGHHCIVFKMTKTQRSGQEKLQGCHVMPSRVWKDGHMLPSRERGEQSNDKVQTRSVPTTIGSIHQQPTKDQSLVGSPESTTHPTTPVVHECWYALEPCLHRARRQFGYHTHKDTTSQHTKPECRLGLPKDTLVDDDDAGMRMVESRIRISEMIKHGFD